MRVESSLLMVMLGSMPCAIASCNWISREELDCRLMLVDDDADGFPAWQIPQDFTGQDWCSVLEPYDCDDSDPLVSPGALENWYDGLDQDCAGDDDYDADGDGYVLDEYWGMPTAGQPGSGQLASGDCDDSDGTVYPGAMERWYDGIDSDCAGDDDFDQDKDLYVPDEYLAATTGGVDDSGSLPGGDCDDADPDVNPDVHDTWYDGVDQDCSGNDDYDLDRDGYVTDEHEGLATLYVDGSGMLPGGDCDDQNGTLNPGAKDEWYDGVDQDCAGNDDYDQDYDGYPSMYFESGTDCDDQDADVNPGALEVLGDYLDSNCDGEVDAFGFQELDELQWPGEIVGLSFAEADGQVVLSVTSSQVVHGASTYFDSALALVFDSDFPSEDSYDIQAWVQYPADPRELSFTPGLDTFYQDGLLYGVVGLSQGEDRAISLRSFDLASGEGHDATPAFVEGLTFEHLTMAQDSSGAIGAFGCLSSTDDNALSYIWASPETLQSFNTWDYEATYAISGSPCELGFVEGESYLLLGGDLEDGERALVRYGFDECESAESCEVTLTQLEAKTAVNPSSMDLLDTEADLGTDTLILLDGDSRDLKWARIYGNAIELHDWLDFPGPDYPKSIASTVSSDMRVYTAFVSDYGDLGLVYGQLAESSDLTDSIPVDLETGLDVELCQVHASSVGGTLYVAAAGLDQETVETRLVLGVASLP